MVQALSVSSTATGSPTRGRSRSASGGGGSGGDAWRGGSMVARALVEEELGAGDPGAAFALDAPGVGGRLVAALGSADQKRRLLAGFAGSATHAAACALSEAGRGPELSCVAEPGGEGW